MKRLYFLSMITLAILVAVLPQNTNAQTPVWDGSYAPWTHGSGTQSDPYLIENTWHLAWLAHQVNDSAYTYNGKYFRLTTDLDMNSQEWTPIGNSTTNCFKGVFDGDGHLIGNVYIISYEYVHDNDGYSGLFGVINNASIMNLGVNSYITHVVNAHPTYTGGIVAYISGSANTIINCYHTGNITFDGLNSCKAKGYCGGIVGYISGETVLYSCQNHGLVRDTHFNSTQSGSYRRVGGLIGKVNANVIISDCSNSAVVYTLNFSSYSQCRAGGLIGESENATITIINSQNNGNINAGTCGGLIGISSNVLNISNSYNTEALSGSGNGTKGGLVGSSTGSCSITNCYNTGTLSDGYSQGGLIGAATGNVSLTHSFNKGSLNTSNGDGVRSGGIIGECYSTGMATILCCANSGNVMFTCNLSSSASSDAHAYCGGIVGYANYPVTIDRCYNIASTSGSGTDANGYHVYKYVGGLAGYFGAAGNNIHEGYNTGAVSTGNNGTNYNKCSGILGYNNGVTSITNCYNVGSLSGGSPQGIADYNSSYIPTVTNCYYLETCGGSSQTGAVAASSTLMKSPSFPYMLNNGVNAFTVDGNPNVNQGYPIFGDMVYAVSTQNATNVGVTRATLNGNYVGGADTVGFQYRENMTSSTWNTVYASVGSPVSYLLTGLQSNTSYVFRFMVLKNGGMYYGEDKTFTTGTCNLTASVSPSSVTLCQGEVVTVTASGQSSLGNQFSYSWNTGETTPTISVLGGGERVVTVSDSNGCTATASVNVTVHPMPTVAIIGNTTLCAGASSTLTASGGNSYLWNTGITTPSITVNSGGTYSVTATNSYGCSSSASVSVTSIENVTISGNLNLCQGQSTTLYANGTGTYQWNTGASTPSITVTQAGPYSVTVSGDGCTSSASATVSIAANPTPTILGNTTFCQGETTTLTANGGVSYVWSNASTSNSISVSQSGVYTVTATNAEGCSATASVTVTVNPLPTITISGNTTLCAGNSTTLTAAGADSYSWSTGDNTASVSISTFGIYSVTGTSAEGCSNTANVTVLVSQMPVITITGETDICAGESTTLTANGGETYLWSDGTTDNTLTVSMGGIYQVIGYNAAGCSSMADATVNVWQPATSEFTVECPEPCYEWNGESYCQSGDYTQTLQTVHGCDSVVTLHLTITVGIENHDFAASMTVYPNPTNGIVNVQFTDHNSPITQIHVYDVYGKLLGVNVVGANDHSPIQQATAQIDLSRYANGVYFIKAVTDGNVVAVRKLIKNSKF